MQDPRLKDLGRWYSGGTPPRADEQLWTGDVPWVSGKDFNSDRLRKPTAFISEDAAKRYSRVVPAGAIVVLVRGMALAHGLPVAIAPSAIAINQDVRAVVLRPGYESRFLHYAIVAARPRLDAHIDRAAHGTARVVESLYGVRLLVPNPVEQRKIADFLDGECARIAALDDKLTSSCRLLRQDALAELHETLMHLPAEMRPLRSAVQPARPIMYGIVLPGEPVEDGILLVKGGNVERNELLPEHLVKVSYEIEARYARARLAAGDLLVTIRGSFGAVAQVPPETAGANITQDTARVAVGSHADATFVLHALRSPAVQRQIGERVRGTGVKGLNIYDLKRIRLPMPELAEQRRLAALFDERDVSGRRLTNRYRKLQARLGEYREALISEAVTGQLNLGRLSEAEMEERASAALEGAAA